MLMISNEDEPAHKNSNHDQLAQDDGEDIKIPAENVYERYPAYGWEAKQGNKDVNFWPAFPPANAAHKYGNVLLPGLRSPDISQGGSCKHKEYKEYLISYDLLCER